MGFILPVFQKHSPRNLKSQFPVVAAAMVIDDELGGVAWGVEEGAVGGPQVDGGHGGGGRVRCCRIRGGGADSGKVRWQC